MTARLGTVHACAEAAVSDAFALFEKDEGLCANLSASGNIRREIMGSVVQELSGCEVG